jgi:hypothetical protein
MSLPPRRVAPILAAACALLLGWLLIMPHVGTNADPPKPREQFAGGLPIVPNVKPGPFDGRRAMGYLRDLCKIGPRVSGSAGMKNQQDLIAEHFRNLGAKVEFQRFQAKQISQSGAVAMANMVVSWHPDRARRILICSHYDTRPKADQEPDRNNWDKPFVSANDGTAGVAFLMEMGNHIKQLSLTVGVDFVLFDGEEFIFDQGPPNGRDKYFFGSDHFADEYRKDSHGKRYAAAVLLDMAAGKDASFPVELNSWSQGNLVVNEIWGIANELAAAQFKFERGPSVNDDHIALHRVGIPAVDIIDFSYPHWHRLSDTPEQCSAETMTNVSNVLTVWLQRAR